MVSARLTTTGASLLSKSFPTTARQAFPRSQNVLSRSLHQSARRPGLGMQNAKNNFASSVLRNAAPMKGQTRGIVAETLISATVIHGKALGAGMACVGLAGAGVGIGAVFSALINATARNPQLRAQFFQYAILGFALAEAQGLFSIMIAFILLYGY